MFATLIQYLTPLHIFICCVSQHLAILLLLKFSINGLLFLAFWRSKSEGLFKLKLILFGLDLIIVGVICLAYYIDASLYLLSMVTQKGYLVHVYYAVSCACIFYAAYEEWNRLYDPVFLVALLSYITICFITLKRLINDGVHVLVAATDLRISMDDPALIPYSLIFLAVCGPLMLVDPYAVRELLIKIGTKLTWFTPFATSNSGIAMIQTLSSLIFASLNLIRLGNGIQNGLSEHYVFALLCIYTFAVFFQVCIALRSIALYPQAEHINCFAIPFWYFSLVIKLKIYNYRCLKQAALNGTGATPSFHNAVFMLVFASSNVCFILL